MEAPRILIADDQPDVLEALKLLLKNEGFEIELATSPRAAIEAIESRRFDVALLDLNYARDTTSGTEGLELLARIQQVDSALPIVLMTAWGSVELAVEAMQGGGRDFVQKPWDNQKLLKTLRRRVEESYGRRQQRLQEKASAQLMRDMEEAHDIQRRLLPTEMPRLAGCEIRASWKPAGHVGGDYFDAIRRNDTSVSVCIADVSGKGMPAALLMSNMQAAVRSLTREASSSGDLCHRLNRLVLKNTATGKFVTFFCATLDSEAQVLRFTNAGHVPPFLLRRDGTITRLSDGGAVLGIFGDATYEEFSTPFHSGDRLVLITDGISEAENEQDQEFGEDRLMQLLADGKELSTADLQKSILDAVHAHARHGLQDDATLMIVSKG
jgi:sigma-B regulation protein RsbU (phosphoserine phosphatase)